MRSRIDPISHLHSGGRVFGLPPQSKFRSGLLPTSGILVSRTIPGAVDDSGTGSDNDITTNSEDGGYGGRYSLDSSPQDERISNGAAAHRYGNRAKRESHYSTDYTYSDVGSSMETIIGRQKYVAKGLGRGTGCYPVGQNGYTEDEYGDSAASSEFSGTQVGGSINGNVLRKIFLEG